MIKVKITTNTDWPIINQTPERAGIWGDYQFFINDNTIECDYWFILYGLNKITEAKCSNERIFFVSGEPSSIKIYNQKFVDQFSGMLVSEKNIYKNRLLMNYQTGYPWMIGGYYDLVTKTWNKNHSKDYDELKELFGKIEKRKLISVISSDKNSSSGHKLRLEFIKKLKVEFGNEIDFYGRGLNTFNDKWDVIAPYKYHIVLENDICEDYFTEKLSDCFLSEAFPIYYGCKNIHDYFAANSMQIINIKNIDESINTIKEVIRGDFYEKNIEHVKFAKKLVLEKYNLFPNLIHFIETNDLKKIRDHTTNKIYPEEFFVKKNRIFNKLLKWIKQIQNKN